MANTLEDPQAYKPKMDDLRNSNKYATNWKLRLKKRQIGTEKPMGAVGDGMKYLRLR